MLPSPSQYIQNIGMLSAGPHVITIHNIVIFIVAALKTLNLTDTHLDAIHFNHMTSMTAKIPGLECYVDTSTKIVHDG
jgi:hypothetical protein